MKLTGEYKNHYLIIGTALVIIAVWYFFLRKKDTKESGFISGGDKCSCTSCERTDPFNGQVSVYYKGCNTAQANNGWSTITQEKDCPCPSASIKGPSIRKTQAVN